MIGDALILLRGGMRAHRSALRRVAPEQVAVVLIGLLACGWALRAATHGLLAGMPAGRAAYGLATVAVVAGTLFTASAATASLAIRPEIAPFAHRFSPRGLQLARSAGAAALGALGVVMLLAVLVPGTRLAVLDVARLAAVDLPAGVLLGLGIGFGVEGLTRAVVRTRAVLPASRFATSLIVLLTAGGIAARSGLVPVLVAVAASAWIVLLATGGVAPLRPHWLAQRRTTRRSRWPLRSLARQRFWHPLCLLWRDPLGLPSSAALVVLIGIAGTVGRYPSTESLGQMYVGLWPLLVIVPASAGALVVVAKAIPAGGGLAGHRIRPAESTCSVVAVSLVAGVSVTLLGALTASLSGGSWMTMAELARFSAVAVVASVLALVLAAVRPVRAAAVDLPASVSLAHLGAGSVLVGGLTGAAWTWLGSAVVGSVLAAVPALTAVARKRAPFTR
ncbi:hypothetical protein ACPPVT_19995 [Angustibacter sp. McL0619]|uniref:hypothetical protein n=1 Tax=Angustibacter sp. McL0619 TaxID=3415676 RepID=UPI003CEB9D85